MHIAYLIPTIDRIGGAERQLMLLAAGMARRDWRVTVIALAGDGGQAAQNLSAANVSFLSLEMRRGLVDPHGWNRLRRWIDSAKPEIFHAHLAQAALMARCIRLLAPVRVLIDTIHSPATGSATRRFGYRITSGLPNVITAVSQACANPWLSARTLRRSELAVIPNGIDTEYWKPASPSRDDVHPCSTKSDEFHWIAVGRLNAVKDYPTLLQAFSILPQTARLTIAGSGPLESALHLQATELGIGDRVRFLGFQSDMRRLMQHSDGFVLSSRWEGHPIALMEASACELPVVFTETPGSRELLPSSALPIAPAGDPSALAIAMKALMDLPKCEQRRLGRIGRQRIRASFEAQSVLARFESLYCGLLAANPCRSRYREKPYTVLPARVCSSSPET